MTAWAKGKTSGENGMRAKKETLKVKRTTAHPLLTNTQMAYGYVTAQVILMSTINPLNSSTSSNDQ